MPALANSGLTYQPVTNYTGADDLTITVSDPTTGLQGWRICRSLSRQLSRYLALPNSNTSWSIATVR